LMHSLGHHVLKPFRIGWECDLLWCWQRILLKNTTFSLTIWCHTKLFIMLHVGLELSFVWIFQSLVIGWTFSGSTSKWPFFIDLVIVDFFVSHSVCQKCLDAKIGRYLRVWHTWLPGL
jgi:hypothetical protein